ncbi:ring-cleaving dioxygenase [Planococcus salinus]|uniref:Ring-cleaving dioxygenase n=1 Tax=Planococcus salinus TaxID=1848460 RepID=A0A3M8P3C5_9BACL|nr:ring-cleaving dioxygenase [Planococcus salinus]RNF38213.1 ring-cleaving dioxygenase [Planococcus salinus]
MTMKSKGIHHITAVVGDPQENVDFYAGVLGLRLVKQTVNFDDPGTYHLYFGNEGADPGTIITFFPWGKEAYNGKIGDGQVGTTTYAVPPGALEFWEKRLERFSIPFTKSERFGEKSLQFEDPHGLRLELSAREEGTSSSWEPGDITREQAIKGFSGATLFSANAEKTVELLQTVMGFEKVGEEDGFVRFKTAGDTANFIDVKLGAVGAGRLGVGTVHHIAWRAADDQEQLAWKTHIEKYGLGVTPVQDRNYFNSIYFREYGDLLFEIATDPPGFTIDEPQEALGEALMLPKQYEKFRSSLMEELDPITVRKLE